MLGAYPHPGLIIAHEFSLATADVNFFSTIHLVRPVVSRNCFLSI